MGCLAILFLWFCVCAWMFDDEGIVGFVAFVVPAIIAVCIWIQDAFENNKRLASDTDCEKTPTLTPKTPEIHRERYPILPRHETGIFPRCGEFKGYAIIEKSDLIKQNDRIAIYDEDGIWIGYLIPNYWIEYKYKVGKTKKTPVNISIENASEENNAYAEFCS